MPQQHRSFRESRIEIECDIVFEKHLYKKKKHLSIFKLLIANHKMNFKLCVNDVFARCLVSSYIFHLNKLGFHCIIIKRHIV